MVATTTIAVFLVAAAGVVASVIAAARAAVDTTINTSTLVLILVLGPALACIHGIGCKFVLAVVGVLVVDHVLMRIFLDIIRRIYAEHLC